MKGPTKFRRIARNILDQFSIGYQFDPELAKKELAENLKNERDVTVRYVLRMIKKRYPQVYYND